MELISSEYRNWRLYYSSSLKLQESKAYFEIIINESYHTNSILKDHHRSTVKQIKIDNRNLVFKIPHEKNSRLWIRFLTLFRKGEAFKNIDAMKLFHDKGINTTTPLMAAEKRNFGMVVNSWLLYEYLDGESCLDRPETYPSVISTLKKIHENKLTHGDPQIRNFIEKENAIYVIDTNPKSPGITGFDEAYEWVYLRKSAPGIEELFGKIRGNFWYKFAFRYDLIERKIARFRRRLKSLFRNSS